MSGTCRHGQFLAMFRKSVSGNSFQKGQKITQAPEHPPMSDSCVMSLKRYFEVKPSFIRMQRILCDNFDEMLVGRHSPNHERS